MKHLAIALMVLSAVPALAIAERQELDAGKCVHYDDPNDDPRLGVNFNATQNGYTTVTITKRMTDSGESWKEIFSGSEPVKVSPKSYAIGTDNVLIGIQRPVPGWNKAKAHNAVLILRHAGQAIPLTCENIKQ
jgi:hypothetical protein